MVILVLNCGSSSAKFRVYRVNTEAPELVARGSIDRIGLSDSALELRTEGKEPLRVTRDVANHQEAINLALGELLQDPVHGCISDIHEIQAVGHRVVHGGEHFSASTLITPEVKDAIEECAKFAPLHNPPNLNGVWACERVLPEVPQVAVFDTAFHSTLAPEAYLYALPYELYEKEGIRRYGFHGTSHHYVVNEAHKLLDTEGTVEPPYRIVTCHLGNGASAAAVLDGTCIDTSMGFTPLEGLVMGTRCGDIDPAVVLHLLPEYGQKPLDRVLNKESGLKGLTGFSDMRDVLELAKGVNPQGDGTVDVELAERAEIAIKVYTRRIRKYIGAYAAVLGGLDAVVFTAGIGENSAAVRAQVLEGLEFLGLHLDPEANETNATVVSTPDSPARVFAIPTNEELVIAQQTYDIVRKG